jgi:hypothetical protein
MGNTLDSPPTSFSRNDPSKMQQDSWTNTYTNDPNAKTDRITWGNKGSHLAIGVKILQDLTNSQLYVKTAAGQKIWLTDNGKPLPNAAQLIKQGTNWGVGPAVMISGNPLKPTYSMFSAGDESSGQGYKEININSMADVKYAMSLNDDAYNTNEVTDSYLNNKNSGQFGEASVSGPFAPRPRDVWSGVADFNRASNDIFEKIVIPVAADVIGKVIPGFGFISQVTGLQDDLQSALDKAYYTKKELAKPTQFQNYMSDRITDPRLQPYYAQTLSSNAKLLKQTGGKASQQVQQMQSRDNASMLLKGKALETSNSSLLVQQTETQMNDAIAKLKKTLGNKVDWSYYDQMQYGLAATPDDDAKMNILSHFANSLSTNVLPILKQHQSGESTQPAEQPSVPPKGGSLGALPYHPWVINGNYFHKPGKVTIQG